MLAKLPIILNESFVIVLILSKWMPQPDRSTANSWNVIYIKYTSGSRQYPTY